MTATGSESFQAVFVHSFDSGGEASIYGNRFTIDYDFLRFSTVAHLSALPSSTTYDADETFAFVSVLYRDLTVHFSFAAFAGSLIVWEHFQGFNFRS